MNYMSNKHDSPLGAQHALKNKKLFVLDTLTLLLVNFRMIWKVIQCKFIWKNSITELFIWLQQWSVTDEKEGRSLFNGNQ